MGLEKRTRVLSSISRKLLARGESDQADYKRAPEGISSDDLVAFANTATGGHILVGVDEQSVDGTQVGIVRGCDVSDATILQILNKAVSCIPPVAIEIFVENLDALPILRIAVQPSSTRPHCTPRGIYCRRDGSRIRALHPSELLGIFLETEARAFSDRFEAAAKRITDNLDQLESNLDSSIKGMADQLGWADFKLGDTEDKLDAVLGQVAAASKDTQDIATRIRTIFRQDSRADPVRDREYEKLVQELIEQLEGDPNLKKAVIDRTPLQFAARGKMALELTKDDLQKAYDEASAIIIERHMIRYSIDCRPPSECTENMLTAFAKIVSEGGEVAEGLRNRIEGAHTLGFVTYNRTIVGTAALKRPAAAYRTKVFASAKSERDPTEFPFELGWIFLKSKHRRKGQMTRLLDTLLPRAKGRNIFATTRSGNEIMQEMLVQMKFLADGEAYPSALHPDETIQLFLLSDGARGDK